MRRTFVVPFELRHLDESWVEDRHKEALDYMLANAHVQRAMVCKWAVTFLDAMNMQLLGCFGVIPQTNECWAFLHRRLLDQDCYRQHKVEIVRACLNILNERNRETGKPAPRS
jgi:recombinational DNA repair protein (RecF pathway)